MKVQLQDKSQVNGEDTQVQKENEFRDEFLSAVNEQGKKKTERIAEVFEKYPSFRDEFLTNEEGFLSKYGSAAEEEPDEADDSAPEEGWLEKKNIEDGKLAEEREKLAKEREKLAQELKERDEAIKKYQSDMEALKAEIAKKKEEKPKTKIDIPEDDPVLPEDVDLFTEEGAAKFKEYAGSLGKTNKSLRDALRTAMESVEELKGKIGSIDSVKTKVDALEQTTTEKRRVDNVTAEVQSEFEAIDNMVRLKDNEDIFGEVKRSVKAIEDDQLKFMKGILDVAGETGGLFNPDGQYSREAVSLLELYNDESSEKGKKFRALCKREGVAPPEDYEVLDTVYQVRNFKNKVGNYDDALLMWKGQNLGRFRVEDRLANRQARERAVEKRKKFARETRTQDPSEAVDLTKFTERDVEKFLSTPVAKRTEEQKEFFRNVFRQKSLTEAEIRLFVDGEGD